MNRKYVYFAAVIAGWGAFSASVVSIAAVLFFAAGWVGEEKVTDAAASVLTSLIAGVVMGGLLLLAARLARNEEDGT